jgi:hypothetical protein
MNILDIPQDLFIHNIFSYLLEIDLLFASYTCHTLHEYVNKHVEQYIYFNLRANKLKDKKVKYVFRDFKVFSIKFLFEYTDINIQVALNGACLGGHMKLTQLILDNNLIKKYKYDDDSISYYSKDYILSGALPNAYRGQNLDLIKYLENYKYDSKFVYNKSLLYYARQGGLNDDIFVHIMTKYSNQLDETTFKGPKKTSICKKL